MITIGSLFSGIEGLGLGVHRALLAHDLDADHRWLCELAPWKLPEPQDAKKRDRWLAEVRQARLRHAVLAARFPGVPDGSTESVFIASDGQRAWVVDGLGALCQVVERGQYAAIGAGAGEALGALHVLHPAAPSMAPHLAARMAVNAAVRWSTLCGGDAAAVQHVNDAWVVV